MESCQNFQEEKKACSSCKKLKPLSLFYKQGKRLESLCKVCKKKKEKEEERTKKKRKEPKRKLFVRLLFKKKVSQNRIF